MSPTEEATHNHSSAELVSRQGLPLPMGLPVVSGDGLSQQDSSQGSPRSRLIIRCIQSRGSTYGTTLTHHASPAVFHESQPGIKTTRFRQSLILGAAMFLAAVGFLCWGELTIPDHQPFHRTVHMSIQDITGDTNPPGLSFHIKASKTDPFCLGGTVNLGQTSVDLCPVAARSEIFLVRETSPGPLFGFREGSGLHRQQLVTTLRCALLDKGLNSSQYCGDSFRSGAATMATQKGIADCTIRMLHRWQSTACQLYIRTPRTDLASHYISNLYLHCFERVKAILTTS